MSEDTEGDLQRIRTDLREKREHVDDAELRTEVQEWIATSHDLVDADSVAEFVSSRLTEMLAKYTMYNSSGVDSGTEAFPNACADCPHYGSACPVLVGPVEPEFRERKLADAETEAEQRQVFERQAVDTGCVRIPEFLEEWDNEYAAFVHRGEDLLHRAEEDILGSGSFGASADDQEEVES
jgi:hypothetical protein